MTLIFLSSEDKEFKISMSKAIKASMNQNIYEIKESIKASNVLNHLLPQWTLDILLLFILGIDWMTNTNECPNYLQIW